MMRRTLAYVLALASLGLLLAACGPNHIQPFTARDRKYNPGEYADPSRRQALQWVALQ